MPSNSTGAEKAGSTTMNNDNAKAMLKNFMNYSSYSILLGYKENTGTPFIGFYGMSFKVTYTAVTYKALFPNIPLTYKMERDSNNNVEMWLFEDELNMSFEEIMKRRAKENRAMINPSDVTINSL